VNPLGLKSVVLASELILNPNVRLQHAKM